MSELRPCPFCGQIPKFRITHGSFGYSPSVIHLECRNCNVDMSKCDNFNGGKDHTDEIKIELVERWNKRV